MRYVLGIGVALIAMAGCDPDQDGDEGSARPWTLTIRDGEQWRELDLPLDSYVQLQWGKCNTSVNDEGTRHGIGCTFDRYWFGFGLRCEPEQQRARTQAANIQVPNAEGLRHTVMIKFRCGHL